MCMQFHRLFETQMDSAVGYEKKEEAVIAITEKKMG